MLDPTFGSHYVPSAIDLAVLAKERAKGPVPDIPAAIRLYKLAVADMEFAIKELEPHGDQYTSTMATCAARIILWTAKIEQLGRK